MLWLPLVIGLGLALTVFQADFREEAPSWAVLLALGFVATILLALIPQISTAFQGLVRIAQEASVSSLYLSPVLKTIGVAYITSFGVQISQEAGEEAIAAVMELAGKLVIILIALPLMQTILNTLFAILGY